MTPAELSSIGESLYGERWQEMLAAKLPCSERSIRHWLSGKRKIMPMVEARIRSLVGEKK